MPHTNTLFHAVLKRVPWDQLDAAVARHKASDCARRFSFKSHLTAMVFAQLSGAPSLRAIEDGLRSHANRLYHLGAEPACKSSLADANRDRPAKVFADLLGVMIQCVHRPLRRAMDGVTCLIDSTNLLLSRRSENWAHFSDEACGAKLHVVYDPDGDCPIYAAVTPRHINDITAAQAMPIEPDRTYVFDLGYYDYAWWAKIEAAGSRIVTRLKQNTPLRVLETRPVPDGGAVLSDQVGYLPARRAASRRNPLNKPVREVRVRLDTGPVLRIVSNDLQASAQKIANLYKRRWAVELFFRWIKQTLCITRFLGTSENAVRVQLIIALIAFLLLRMAQQAQTAIQSPLAFARLVRLNLLHQRRLDQLARWVTPTKPIKEQASLFPT